MLSVSVCICTRNRPEELARTLESVRASSRPVDQVVVSDDSQGPATRQLIESRFPEVIYTAGPRRGLGANRNTAVEHASGEFVLFLDDDCLLDEHWLEHALDLVGTNGDRARTIVTGLERNSGNLVGPADQDFLGFQRVPYASGDALKTVVINSALFPRELFRTHRFDEQLVYGCDEVDLTTRAVAAGYRIALCQEAVNDHRPAPSNRDYYSDFAVSSRIYVTFKRYFRTERRRAKGVLYLPVAAAHAVLSAVRHVGLARGLAVGARAVSRALGYIRRGVFGRSAAV
jgi:GT2 family glycosyltransferase